MNKDLIIGAINMSIELAAHYQSDKVPVERFMTFQVIELPTKFKVEFKWLVHITKRGHENYADEYFTIEKPLDHVKIDKQVEAVIAKINATKIVDESVDLNDSIN